MAKSRKETSLNNLETAIIETREKLDQPDYASAATDVEIKSILDKCSEVICINYMNDIYSMLTFRVTTKYFMWLTCIELGFLKDEREH